jgi:hypothetical protein
MTLLATVPIWPPMPSDSFKDVAQPSLRLPTLRFLLRYPPRFEAKGAPGLVLLGEFVPAIFVS